MSDKPEIMSTENDSNKNLQNVNCGSAVGAGPQENPAQQTLPISLRFQGHLNQKNLI